MPDIDPIKAFFGAIIIGVVVSVMLYGYNTLAAPTLRASLGGPNA